jgi:hypothetical protein
LTRADQAEAMTLSVILRRAAALCSAAAAAIHFGVTSEHFHEWWLYGAFFLVLAAYQLWWAAIAWQAPSRREVAAGAAVNTGVLALWWLTRTSGLPFGPDAGHAEPFGTADVLCSLLEAAVVAVAVLVLVGSPVLERGVPGWRGTALVAAVAALALAGTGVALAAPGESADAMEGMDGADATHTAGSGDMGSGGGSGAMGSGTMTDGERHQMSDLPTVDGATAAQTAAARTLLTSTEADTAKYRTITAAERAGFLLAPALKRWHANHPSATAATPIKELHVANPAYRADGKVADPTAPETLIYSQRGTARTWTLIGVMYVAPNGQPGPDLAGPYTRWHYHDTTDAGRPEPKTGYMMHVWFVAPDQLRAAYAMTPPVAQITAYQRALSN